MASTPPLSLTAPLGTAFTRTSGQTANRVDIVVDQPRSSVDTRVAFDAPLSSDLALHAAPSRVDAIDVLGLGPLGSSKSALDARAAKLVRAQGLRVARLRVKMARRSVEDMATIAERSGDSNSLARANVLRHRLDVLGSALNGAGLERDRIERAMTPRAAARAHALLDAAETRVAAMRALYLSGTPRALRSLRDDARGLLEARGLVNRASDAAERAEAVAAYDALHADVASRNPPLAPMRLDADLATLIDFARTTTTIVSNHDAVDVPRSLDQPLRAQLDRTRAAIDAMRDRLHNNPETVWALPAVIEATLIAEGAPNDGMVAAYARDVVRDVRSDDRLLSTFLGIATMGLGIAAALPTGGASVTVALAATAAADAYQLGRSLVAYQHALDAADSGLSTERPSPFAVLSDAAFLAIGVLGAAAAGTRALRPAAPAVRGQTGGGIVELAVDDWAAAERVYGAIRADQTDVAAIAENLGVKPANIEKIKKHLFHEPHLLDRYAAIDPSSVEMRVFDADPRIANAWRRLTKGTHTADDLKLLQHEMAEAWFMRRHGPSYSAAHGAAQKRYPSPME